MALGTYPEPHSRLPGGDYVEKELVPHGDLNQIVGNQKTLWAQLARVTYVPLAHGDIGDGVNPINTTDSSNAIVAVPYSTFSTNVLANDEVEAVFGPVWVVNSDATHAATIYYRFIENVGGTNTVRDAVQILIPANVSTFISIPVRRTVVTAGTIAGGMYVKSGSAGAVSVSGGNTFFNYGFYNVTRPA